MTLCSRRGTYVLRRGSHRPYVPRRWARIRVSYTLRTVVRCGWLTDRNRWVVDDDPHEGVVLTVTL